MGSVDLLSYAQLILATIGIIAIFHRFLFPDRNGVTDITTIQSSAEDEATSIQQAESMYKKILATDDGPRKKLQCSDYSVGIITALPNEMKAAISVLDEEHGPPSDFCKSPGDYNHYVWGSMSTQSEAAHNVVIASFPAKRPGTVTAADVARLMVTTFPSIRLGLMVGIGGGVPGSNDIRLGDIVVSQGSGTTGGVIQYDLGKEEEGGFRRQGQLNSPPAALLSAITAFEARDPASSVIKAVMRASSKIQKTNLNLKNEPTYAYQGAKNDRLFQSQYHGPGAVQWPIVSSLFGLSQRSQPTHKDCASCNSRMLVNRDSRPLPEIPRIHYGLIASGSRVIKSARMRDEIVASLKQDTNGGGCLCFEMEAAGIMNNFPCLVIRGVSDYADAHKNDVWHNYAALTAAAYARELLRVLSTAEVSLAKPAAEIIGQIQKDVKTINFNVQKISDEDFKEKFFKWLKPSQQQTNFDQAQGEIGRYQTESIWFFEHEDYRDWSSHRIRHIWLHGQSGCGKTVLASTIIKRLSAERKLCLYFFFDVRDKKKQSLKSLLRSFIWQLFTRFNSESVNTLVHELYENRDSPAPTIKKLQDMFDRMIEEVDEVQVVLDALDESTKKGTDRDELLHWLVPRTQNDGLGGYKFRSIITSRSDQQDIMDVLESRCPGRREIRIENESAKVGANLHQYIRKRLSNDRGFAEWRKNPNGGFPREAKSQEQGDMEQWHPIMREMEKCVTDKAGLMFRWASLTIDSLGEMGTIQKIKGALESLPTGLDEIYTRSLDEIKHHESDAIRILQLLLFSPGPLGIEYVLDATSVDIEAPSGCGIDPTRRLNSFDKLSSLMSTFIRKDGNDLQIAHSSVRDYLLYTGPGSPPRYRFREISAKATVVAVCLGYLDSFLTHETTCDTRHRDAIFWPRVAERTWRVLSQKQEYRYRTGTKHTAQEGSVQEAAFSAILKFLIHNGSKLQQLTSKYFGDRYDGPPLYVASAIGLTYVVEKLLSAGVRPDEKRGIHGFAEAALLPNSFYKNTMDKFGVREHEEVKYVPEFSELFHGNALEIACEHEHDGIVQMLLDSKDDNSDDETSRRSLLYAACLGRHTAVVERLLKKNVDVNQGGEFSQYPLNAACERGSFEIVNLLLNKGANVNVGNSLAAACESGCFETVKLLLEKGADVNVGNSLAAACKSGCFEIVKLLLQKGANANDQNRSDETALIIACKDGHEGIVRVLLENGADANAGGVHYGCPLQAAIFANKESEAIVKILLQHGVDVNAKGGSFGTPLHAAVRCGRDRIVKPLLDAGADIHIKASICFPSGEPVTILEAACYDRTKKSFQILLEAGADPNSPSPGRSRILQLATSLQRPDIVRYLLETGVELADLDGLKARHQEYVFRVARESCNEVILERLGIRKSLEGSIHHED